MDTLSGVGVLDKAVAILGSLEQGPLALAELSASTGLPRATTHRLAAALEVHRLVGRDGAGRFVLGGRLRALAAASAGGAPGLLDAAGPALTALRDTTGESVQLFVREGGVRVCVLSLESPHSLRTIVAPGAVYPLERGSAGRVLTGGAGGRAWVQTVEERERGVASVSAPVTVGGVVRAAVSVSGPLERTSRSPGRRYGAAVEAAARAIEAALT